MLQEDRSKPCGDRWPGGAQAKAEFLPKKGAALSIILLRGWA